MGIKRVWTYAGAFQTLSIASVISNQYIATKLCILIEQGPTKQTFIVAFWKRHIDT